MLDMSLYMDQRSNKTDNSTYRLVSVAQHIGYINGGHYIVYVRASKMDDRQQQSRDSKSWFCASDEKIREASLQEALDSEAYILVYEKCSTDAFLAAANVTGEKSQLTNTAMLPQAGAPVFDRIPTPLDEFGPWESQKNRKRDKKREEELNLAKEDYEVAMKIWVFLDSFTLFGDNMPYYRFQLMTMVERGLGSRELNIPYSHLLSHSNSKELAMDVCNGYDRLRLQLTETAREYMQKLMPGLNVTESARKLMQQLELKILEMPKV